MFKTWKQKCRQFFLQEGPDWGKEETEFLPAALEVVETPPSPVGRIVLWTLFAVVVCTLIWSIVGKVDEVAIAPGKVMPIGHVKTLQAEDKGIIKKIYVKEGQRVSAGELLLEFDTTITAADLERLKKESAYLQLEIDRLLAERDGTPFVPDMQKYQGIEAKDLAYQQSLYGSRLSEYRTKMLAAQANLAQSEAALRSALATQDKQVGLFAIAQEKERRIESLVSENAVATFTLFDHQAKRLELQQDISAQASEISRLQWAIAQSREAIQLTQAERLRDVTTKLVDDQKQFQSYSEELKKAQNKDRLTRVVAPMDGRVSQLALHTVGGIVTPAQPLMDIVPEDAELLVEAWVANKDIGFVQIGQTAEVKIETFSFQKFGTLDAEVTDISPDATEDKDKGRVYSVLLKLKQAWVEVNGKEVALTSGMTATGEIKIRQKRVIEFFLDPFRQYKSEALRER